MVAVTYGVGRVSAAGISAADIPAAKSADAGAARKPWYARLLDAMIESRMQQANREIRMHMHLLATRPDERGNRPV